MIIKNVPSSKKKVKSLLHLTSSNVMLSTSISQYLWYEGQTCAICAKGGAKYGFLHFIQCVVNGSVLEIGATIMGKI